MGLRVGIGYDAHRFAPGRDLVLGGVRVPFEQGLLGHSDADVLTHALMDALLGAARAKDIGHHFPDTDEAFAGASSIKLLEQVATIVRAQGFEIVDADCVLQLEAPKIAHFREEMRSRLADAMGVPLARVGLKATTTEGLGFVGRQEGVAAQAVVLLESTTTRLTGE
ncbi:MAG: 2-C-methyl-D-erythritol 2,4-cyclodiphosphate synthase [Actinobacteria bacterium]|nr:2-C-methyl-D-erythritol 2,4-cyclodiphosphate synthase [Actinomycetota bacterium]